MVLAGGLVGLNVRERRIHWGALTYLGVPRDIYCVAYGWPFNALYPYYIDDSSANGEIIWLPTLWNWSKIYIALDIAIALSILFAVWFVLEWRIKRQAAKPKGDH